MATMFYHERLIAIEMTAQVMGWKNVAQPMNVFDAYGIHRQFYEASRLDLSKGIMLPETMFATVVETAGMEKAAHEKSTEE